MQRLTDFIKEHLEDDPKSLLLRKISWPETPAPLLEAGLTSRDIAAWTIEGRKRLRTKLPLWYSNTDLLYPTELCTQQCSSEQTALLKAELVRRILPEGGTVADLTSGLGADVWAFSKVARKVLYNDMNKGLCECVKHNFSVLGIQNTDFESMMVSEDTIDELLSDAWAKPDLIFVDPARRDNVGKKVFLLEDCQPDVLSLMPKLKRHSGNILMKLSPMADISMVCSRLEGVGAKAREVHIISSSGECKELLVWIDSSYSGETKLIAVEPGGTLELTMGEESGCRASYPEDKDQIFSAEYLFEPGKSVSKAGIFNYICQRFSLKKAGVSTHLYTCTKDQAENVKGLGKLFRIVDGSLMGGKAVKEIARKYPSAEVTSKNLPISSDALRKKLGVKNSDSIHIFAFRADFAKGGNDSIILVCERVS